jgi:hypothetical protein
MPVSTLSFALCVLLAVSLLAGHPTAAQHTGLNIETDILGQIQIDYVKQLDGTMPAKSIPEVISDKIDVLQLMNASVPASARMAASRMGADVARMSLPTTARLSSANVIGSKSTFVVDYVETISMPAAAKASFEAAFQLWADVFPSNGIPIKVQSTWGNLGASVLGSASAGFITMGDQCEVGDLGNMPDQSWYTPAVVAAIRGADITTATRPYHIQMTFNSAFTWHTDPTTPCPSDKVDLMSVAAHEICHGLFFASRSNPDTSKTMGSYYRASWSTRYDRTPARLDQFLKVGTSGATSLSSKCESYTAFYSAIAGGNLWFRDTAATSTTNFQIHAPTTYSSGSSGSHFDTDATIMADCTVAGIAAADCSQLMTPSIGYGEMTRTIGENTKRVMNSILSKNGFQGGKCRFNKFVTYTEA